MSTKMITEKFDRNKIFINLRDIIWPSQTAILFFIKHFIFNCFRMYQYMYFADVLQIQLISLDTPNIYPPWGGQWNKWWKENNSAKIINQIQWRHYLPTKGNHVKTNYKNQWLLFIVKMFTLRNKNIYFQCKILS